jgi:hypothetical protein
MKPEARSATISSALVDDSHELFEPRYHEERALVALSSEFTTIQLLAADSEPDATSASYLSVKART